MRPLFSAEFLSNYISDFNLSTVVDIRGKISILTDLINELKAGKIQSLKEEEIKSRFINSFFGDVLGFNYGNSEHWMLREEKKSFINGTKPDAILGYCFVDKEEDDVRVVIEMKDAKTELDEKQNRVNKQSPVEQAFSYAPQMGGNCKWIIVSNIREIRFYPSNDMIKCQMFLLEDLISEIKLKELFYLFDKDRFIRRNGDSNTDKLFEKSKTILPKNNKGVHIIDKIYTCLKRFEGFG